MHMSESTTYLIYRNIYIHMHILHSSSSKSSARPATNRRNATRRAEANANGGALDFEQELCSICICLSPLHTSYTDTYISYAYTA